MDLVEQKKRFYSSVYPSRPNEWEVDEIFERMSELDGSSREALLSHVGAIWPVSHSLCFDYLSKGADALKLLPEDLLAEWVRQILGLYESKGLLGARQFMADIEGSFLGPMRGQAGVSFDELSTRMVHYSRGISGRSFEFGVAQVPTTDTRTIFLPGFLDTFQEKEKNILLYKLLVTLQWANVESRVFFDTLGADNITTDLFSRYPDRQLAVDIFSILQFGRVYRYLKSELPGLVRQAYELCLLLIRTVEPGGVSDEKCNALRSAVETIVSGKESEEGFSPGIERTGANSLWEPKYSCVIEMLSDLYSKFSRLPGTYMLGSCALLLGEFDFRRAGETITLKRKEDENRFVAMLASILEQKGARESEEGGGGNVPKVEQDSLLLILKEQQQKRRKGARDETQLDNEGLELPEELLALIDEIEDDLGTLPEAYVQAASGLAGGGLNKKQNSGSGEVASFTSVTGHSYDEWDYRRGGYRADWCSLYEKTLNPVRSGFVAATLLKYRPQMLKLRRQFEMLRTRDRFIKRRRHGDDIDLDALIEALGDTRAGLTPSDRLFVRLLRDERDITTMFLVDMSNSTQGWVGVALKESLVLLTEALEAVGDQYGIYGFSGMRRSKSELYQIKNLQEPYGAEVQQRIGAITPKEYTRMGPPIRHLTKMLLNTQSKVRLLLVISDGKPEDYDDYKGQYAIEDTRKALLEARGAGIYPFCITIDKSAHEYLAHMFGRGNYVFVDNVPSLPAKLAEMYRLLTS
jgi:nitric oxide reductase NorD protein